MKIIPPSLPINNRALPLASIGAKLGKLSLQPLLQLLVRNRRRRRLNLGFKFCVIMSFLEIVFKKIKSSFVRSVRIETSATGFLDILAGLLLGGGLGGFAKTLVPWLVVVVSGEIVLGRNEFNELIEEERVVVNKGFQVGGVRDY